MSKIYMLNVTNKEDEFQMPFSTAEKAQAFILTNFKRDMPKMLTSELYYGTANTYVIDEMALDQTTF